MELNTYLEQVRRGLADASALADEQTQDVARRLGTAVDSSTRLALVNALTDAASEISADLAPGSVRLRLVDNEPVFDTDLPVSEPADFDAEAADPGFDDAGDADPGPDGADDADLGDDDEPQARISFRVPQSVKAKLERAAAAEQVSVNTWLLQRSLEALRGGDRGGRGGRAGRGRDPRDVAAMGAGGRSGRRAPFGPPFAAGPDDRIDEVDWQLWADARGGRGDRRDRRRDGRSRSDQGRGFVQGWFG